MQNDDNTCESSIDNLFYAYADNLKNSKKLSIEQLKRHLGLEDISEENAHKIIDGLHKLTIITYKIFKHGIRPISTIH